MSRLSTSLAHDERSGIASDADTIDEFAFRNRISRSQVYKEIGSGRLVARKIASRTIITREDAAAWRNSLPAMTPKSKALESA